MIAVHKVYCLITYMIMTPQIIKEDPKKFAQGHTAK